MLLKRLGNEPGDDVVVLSIAVGGLVLGVCVITGRFIRGPERLSPQGCPLEFRLTLRPRAARLRSIPRPEARLPGRRENSAVRTSRKRRGLLAGLPDDGGSMARTDGRRRGRNSRAAL
jgi:hypothetical protein